MARVVFTEPAEYDLLDIEYYIFVDLCNPQAAKRISDGILGAADKLAEYPEGHPLVGEELLGRMGIRITYFDNYNIFYYYDSLIAKVKSSAGVNSTALSNLPSFSTF